MTTYFLAIGINHYTDRAFRALSCCENDATELHSLFKRNLELGDHARKLVGAVSIGDVKNELRRIGQEIRNGDTFVFFFAGHGYQHPKKEDQYLLFPDADAILVNNGHRDGMLALSALRDLTEHWTGVARVFILDACRSWLPGRGAEGARFDNETALAYLASRSPRLSPELEKPGNATAPAGGALPPVILNATRNGQEAKELEDRQRGVLALALEQSLENQQQTGQVIFLSERLLGDISRRMTELLQHGRLGVEQTPFLTPSSAQVLLFKPARSAEPAHDDDETEWAITCAKGTLGAYEAYARRKPPGKHLADALKKIAELSKPELLASPTFPTPHSGKPEPVLLNLSAIDTTIPDDKTVPAPPRDKPELVVEVTKPPIDDAWSVWRTVSSVIGKLIETGYNVVGNIVIYGLAIAMLIYIGGYYIRNAYRDWTHSNDEASAAPASAAVPLGVSIPKSTTLAAPLRVFRDKLKGGGEGPALVVIPAGSFEMGSNDSDADSYEKPVHRVSIKQTFAIGKTEVTQKEWRQIMSSDPPDLAFKGCDECPVENVNWNVAQSFIKKLNEQTGKTYRLPSEAEWEYACRAGKSNETYCGGNEVDAVAWHHNNSNSNVRPVAGKAPNAWGLYDMSGNVWEWVEDWYHDSYSGAPSDGSAWVTGGKQEYRVLRGGSWGNFPRDARSASRGNVQPDVRLSNFGFRVARTLP